MIFYCFQILSTGLSLMSLVSFIDAASLKSDHFMDDTQPMGIQDELSPDFDSLFANSR